MGLVLIQGYALPRLLVHSCRARVMTWCFLWFVELLIAGYMRCLWSLLYIREIPIQTVPIVFWLAILRSKLRFLIPLLTFKNLIVKYLVDLLEFLIGEQLIWDGLGEVALDCKVLVLDEEPLAFLDAAVVFVTIKNHILSLVQVLILRNGLLNVRNWSKGASLLSTSESLPSTS